MDIQLDKFSVVFGFVVGILCPIGDIIGFALAEKLKLSVRSKRKRSED